MYSYLYFYAGFISHYFVASYCSHHLLALSCALRGFGSLTHPCTYSTPASSSPYVYVSFCCSKCSFWCIILFLFCCFQTFSSLFKKYKLPFSEISFCCLHPSYISCWVYSLMLKAFLKCLMILECLLLAFKSWLVNRQFVPWWATIVWQMGTQRIRTKAGLCSWAGQFPQRGILQSPSGEHKSGCPGLWKPSVGTGLWDLSFNKKIFTRSL